jgi:hypothetical protein
MNKGTGTRLVVAACAAVLLAGLGLAAMSRSQAHSRPAGSAAAGGITRIRTLPRGTPPHRKPRHWIRISPGQTRTYSFGSVALPFTVVCPKPAGSTIGSGIKQAIRTPLPVGKKVVFGDSSAGESISVAVTSAGAPRVTCSNGKSRRRLDDVYTRTS